MSETIQKVITLDYTLFKDTPEGNMIESTKGKDPLVFLSGAGSMIPEFENNVANLNIGDTFSFPIKSENAYGKRTEEAIIDLPLNVFMQDGKLVDSCIDQTDHNKELDVTGFDQPLDHAKLLRR